MIAPAPTSLLGSTFIYALATAPRKKGAVANLLNLIEKEMKVAMVLTAPSSIAEQQ